MLVYVKTFRSVYEETGRSDLQGEIGVQSVDFDGMPRNELELVAKVDRCGQIDTLSGSTIEQARHAMIARCKVGLQMG